MSVKRVFLIVLDSYGIGELPDAEQFGDKGTNTLASIVKSDRYDTPNMEQFGLFNIEGVDCRTGVAAPIASYGRMAETSMGKDTTIGHWEIAGVVSPEPLPVYPDGFPEDVLDEFRAQTGRGVLCNKPYSGTDVIRDYGEAHMKTGDLIVYTSADSVFQIAAHEEVVPLEQLYDYCKKAREILKGKHGVGRVIARPFLGEPGNFTRTRNRHDYSLLPPKRTMLVSLQEHGFDTWGVGKINDIFAGQGVSRTVSITSNEDGMIKTMNWMDEDFNGLCFVNLVDFDMQYGHRRDIDGYAQAATVFDRQLGEMMEKMQEDDVVIITADHGCDPGYTQTTDHTREHTPMLIYGKSVKPGVSLGTRKSFADIAATVLEMFGVEETLDGESFWKKIKA